MPGYCGRIWPIETSIQVPVPEMHRWFTEMPASYRNHANNPQLTIHVGRAHTVSNQLNHELDYHSYMER